MDTQADPVQPCAAAPETRDWYAWINKMPPRPNTFYIVGDVKVPNPGVEVTLLQREPQGINPCILQLQLILYDPNTIAIPMLVWKQVKYERIGPNLDYKDVQIFFGNEIIAEVEVETIE